MSEQNQSEQSNASAPAVASGELLDRAWKQFKAADDNNRLRLGDAAEVLLEICHLIEKLPPSPLQTEISMRASELRRRMADQAKWRPKRKLSERERLERRLTSPKSSGCVMRARHGE